MKRLALALTLAMLIAVIAHEFRGGNASGDATPADLSADAIPIQSEPGRAPTINFENLGMIASDGVDDPSRAATTSFTCDLDDLDEDGIPIFDDTNLMDKFSSLADTLSTSGDAEHVLVAALLSRNRDPNVIASMTQRALQLDDKHPLILFWAADLCERGQGGEFCASPVVQGNTESVLGKNSAYWARVAAHRHRRGEVAGALKALKRAATEPDYDMYFAEQLLLLERGLAVLGDMSYAQRIYMAFGIAAAMPGEELQLPRICETQAKQDSIWMEACIAYATKLVADRGTIMNQSIGLKMRAMLFESIGNVAEMRAAISARRELEQGWAWNSDQTVALTLDDRVAAGYVDEFVANGEFAAFKFIEAEVSRLKADSDYDPCALAGIGNRDQ